MITVANGHEKQPSLCLEGIRCEDDMYVVVIAGFLTFFFFFFGFFQFFPSIYV